MDTSRLIDSNLEIKEEQRDRFYYDQYQWCIDFRFPMANYVRPCCRDLESYLAVVTQRWNWRNASKLYNAASRKVHNVAGSWQLKDTEQHDQTNLEAAMRMAKFLWHRKDIKAVFYFGWIYIYSNDPRSVLAGLKDIPTVGPVNLKKAVISRERNTLVRRDPVFQHRTYFREKHITSEKKKALTNFLLAQTDIRLGSSLQDWLPKDSQRLKSHYWFEHNNHGVKLMIEMISPGLIGRDLEIVTINKQQQQGCKNG